MNVTQINGWYMATDNRIGEWSTVYQNPTPEQEFNANIVRSFFLNENWSLEAICGMLGCMQGESTINPAFIQATNRYRLPNNAADISDVPNIIMKNFYKEYYAVTNRAFAIGIVQWDGYTNATVPGGTEKQQKLVSYAMRNNIIWYDGWTQMYRLKGEQEYDVNNQTHAFFQAVTISGITYDFNNYPYATASPEILAEAWTAGYERNAGGVGYRAGNARWWYNYFTDPLAPAVIPPQNFLLPLQESAILPPFDPTNPVMPNPPGFDYMPAWLSCIVANINKRKVMKKRWTKV